MIDNEARHVIAEAMWIQRSPHPDTPADRYLPEADGILTALHDDGYAVVKLPEPTHRSTTTGLVMFPCSVSAWPPIRGHNAKVRIGNALKNFDLHPELVPDVVASLLAASKELAL